jgi:hypothetical protein
MFARFPAEIVAKLNDHPVMLGISAVVIISVLLAMGAFLLIKPKR